jgi:molybdopterin-guanine dinucleotide biosynthesis protein B
MDRSMTPLAGPGGTPIVAVVGWKNSGKTTLVTRLVAELTARGLSVATVKHAHHGFAIDVDGTDSARHREAGARQVAIVSSARIAVIKETGPGPEPRLRDAIAMLDPCDVLVVEGFKSAPVSKIEIRRRASASQVPLAPDDPWVVAIVADHATDGAGRPVFEIDQIGAVADFVETLRNRTREDRSVPARPE